MMQFAYSTLLRPVIMLIDFGEPMNRHIHYYVTCVVHSAYLMINPNPSHSLVLSPSEAVFYFSFSFSNG